ncbi:MAG TPA: lipase maturation factor family protein, partial [Kofleriaceae bacterium]|nr:lipase maturation factor family protein [Kofleriaceae bacterium]
YHLRFDWLIWFAAMVEPDETPWAPPSEDHRRAPSVMWMLHVVYKLLDGDAGLRTLIAVDPFDGAKPTFVRIRRFVYHLEPYSEPLWWERDSEAMWLPPVSLATPGLRDALEQYGWPSPTLAR